MNPFLSFIRLLSDPTIAFLLFSLGSAGLLAELYNPNFVTGILGGLALILSFLGLGALPLNVGGLLLIVFGLVLFGLELTVTSHGLLGFGGILCIALGASALTRSRAIRSRRCCGWRRPSSSPSRSPRRCSSALIALVAVRTRRMDAPGGLVGPSIASGTHGVVRRPLAPLGSVYIARRGMDGSIG